jgi:radical SAM superfamily enzyme YgiQ (UPF0313 family)
LDGNSSGIWAFFREIRNVITLINPPGLRNFSGLQPAQAPNPPVGLAYIAGILKQQNYDYSVIDAPGSALDNIVQFDHECFNKGDQFYLQGLTPEEVVRRIPRNTTIVGISCLFSINWILTNRIAKLTRELFPSALLVLGGEHGTACPEYCLKNSPFDIVVSGEGEQAFLDLVEASLTGEDVYQVNGITYSQDGNIRQTQNMPRIRDIDSLPWPDWDSFPIENYIDKHQNNGANLGRSMPIISTRGCPHQCTFCSSPNMWTTRYTLRDPDDLINEMKHYISKYDVTNFDFQDLTAIVKRSWVVKFCQKLIDTNINITWQLPSGTRSEIFDEEVIDLVYRSGCRFFAFAPESGSEEVLKIVKKKVDLDNLFEAAVKAVERGINVTVFFVIGFPCDNKDSLKQTMKIIRKMALAGIQDVVVSKFSPYPGSELFFQLEKEGRIQLSDKYFVSNINYFAEDNPCYSDHISRRKLYISMLSMFLNFYVISGLRYPGRFLATVWNAIVKGREDTRYAKWLVDKFYTRKIWRRTAVTGATTPYTE